MADLRKFSTKMVLAAFKKIGTLASDVQFISANPTGFDFATATPITAVASEVNVKMLEVKTKHDSKNAGTLIKTVVCPAASLPDISPYSAVRLNGELWNVVHPAESDGYLATVTLTREANG